MLNLVWTSPGISWTLSQASVKRPVFATLSRDRFYFTALLAIGIHAVLVLGVTFEQEPRKATTEPLAIELQQGGDALTLDGLAITPNSDPSQSNPPTERKSDQQTFNLADSAPEPEPSLAPSPAPSPTPAAPKKTAPPPLKALNTRQLAEQIVLFDQQAKQTRGDARRRDLSATGAPSAAETAYLAMWRRKCERLGGNNYPAGRLQGELTLRVSIHHSGQLLDVRLLRSSGHEALDAAALKTVRQAAPYQPFNVDMRKRYDELTFTRTWQFSRSGSFIN